MKHITDTAPTGKLLFPSDQFLKKYCGDDKALDFNPQRGEIPTQLHDELRRRFEYVFLALPVHFIKAMNREGKGFSRVYIYNDGEFGDWVDLALDHQGLPGFSSEATSDLCTEFCDNRKAATIHDDHWWHWEVVDNSVWVEVIPEAIAAGKNKRCTLAQLLPANSRNSYPA